MKIGRAAFDGQIWGGEIDGDWFYPFDPDDPNPFSRTGDRIALLDVALLAPVLPTKILAVVSGFLVGRDPIDARKDGMKFTSKLVSSLNNPEGNIVSPVLPESMAHPVIAEGELAVVIARQCRRLNLDNAESAILGFTCINDVSLKGLAKFDGDFVRSKSVDTFCPIGPWVTTDLRAAQVDAGLAISTRINGALRQSGTTGEYTFRVLEAICFASQLFTLMPYDVISLGTPPPPPELQSGDVVEVDIESVGVLRNTVVSESLDGNSGADLFRAT